MRMTNVPDPAQQLRKDVRAILETGKEYRIAGYHTGDFCGLCTEVGVTRACFAVTQSSSPAITIGQAIEVVYSRAITITPIPPLLAEYTREQFERDRFGEGGGA